ncbi:MAG: Na-translocating system protein MpsC family protein [Caldilineaceae bacterium]
MEPRITQGQLEAIAMRCREELDASLRRSGTAAVATIKENILTVQVEHSLAAAEQNLMRRTAGREFFQRYIEELVEQIYPTFARHVEHILPSTVTYTRVRVDCDSDSIVFTFGLRPRLSWSQSISNMHAVTAHHA